MTQAQTIADWFVGRLEDIVPGAAYSNQLAGRVYADGAPPPVDRPPLRVEYVDATLEWDEQQEGDDHRILIASPELRIEIPVGQGDERRTARTVVSDILRACAFRRLDDHPAGMISVQPALVDIPARQGQTLVATITYSVRFAGEDA